MRQHDFSIRALAAASAAVIVTSAFVAFGATGNANYHAALAAEGGQDDAQPVAVLIEPSRIDVVVARDATRTAARLDERLRPRS